MIWNKYITQLKENMDYNIVCQTCDFPSMISGSFISGSSTINGIMCSNPPCPDYFIPILP
jgi:hypothetical protein